MNEPSTLVAQYNNNLTVPNKLADIRGTGNFQPMPYDYSGEVTYFKEFPEGRGKDFSVIEQSPVGSRINNKWNVASYEDSEKPTQWNLKGDAYLEAGLNILNETPTALSSLFFNKTNVNYLSKRIIDDIFKITNVRIKRQDENSLMVIMQNKYIYAEEGWMPSVVHLNVRTGSSNVRTGSSNVRTGSSNVPLKRGEKPCSIKERLSRLNQAVLQEAEKQILSGMRMYLTYYEDASSLPVPLTNPTLSTMKGSRVLQENIAYNPGNSSGIASFNMRNNILN